MERGVVWWALALSTVVLVLLGLLPALADPPAPVLVKPVAECDKGKCVMSETDFRTLQEFHEAKFREIEMANALIEGASEEISKLRAMLQRYAGGCGDKRRT